MSDQGFAPGLAPAVAGKAPDGDRPPAGEEHEVEPFRPDLDPSGQVVSVPSSYALPSPAASSPQPDIVLDTRAFAEDDARHCLDLYVEGTWFARRGIAKDLVFTEISASNSYVALLETFTEARKLVPDFRPHSSLSLDLDDGRYGPAPGAWDIVEAPPSLFANAEKHITLPHTEELRYCFQCRGRGELRCTRCHGHGYTRCNSCNGSGHRTRDHVNSDGTRTTRSEACPFCHHGENDCITCRSRGMIVCNVCDGHQRLIHFIRLDIVWTNSKRSATVDAHDPVLSSDERSSLLQSGTIQRSDGPLVLAEEDVALAPRDDIPSVARINVDVNRRVNAMLAEGADPSVLQHRQRLTVRGVPVYRISYIWKDASKNFWVMGTNRQVFAPGFPIDMMRAGIAGLLGLLLVLAIVGGIGAVVYFVFMS